MSFTIPIWIFYILGGVIALVILFLAFLGVMFFLCMKDFKLGL